MPIRLNLLAEAQAAEEQRRRDPVKRAIWVAGLLVCLMLMWSGSLQLKATMARSQLHGVEKDMDAITNTFQAVQNNQKKVNDIKSKLDYLQQLSANRFLNANLLNALQQATVDDVQLIHVRADQNYIFYEGTKARTNDNHVVPGKPSTWTEKIVLTFDCNDASPVPGDQITNVVAIVSAHPYFKAFLDKTNQVSLKNWGTTQVSPETGKACMPFTLECRYPEKTR